MPVAAQRISASRGSLREPGERSWLWNANHLTGVPPTQSFYTRSLIVGTDVGDVPVDADGNVVFVDPATAVLLPDSGT